jgi:hypothetical protein
LFTVNISGRTTQQEQQHRYQDNTHFVEGATKMPIHRNSSSNLRGENVTNYKQQQQIASNNNNRRRNSQPPSPGVIVAPNTFHVNPRFLSTSSSSHYATVREKEFIEDQQYLLAQQQQQFIQKQHRYLIQQQQQRYDNVHAGGYNDAFVPQQRDDGIDFVLTPPTPSFGDHRQQHTFPHKSERSQERNYQQRHSSTTHFHGNHHQQQQYSTRNTHLITSNRSSKNQTRKRTF